MTDKVVVADWSKTVLPYADCRDTSCVADGDTLLTCVYVPTAMKSGIEMPSQFPFMLMLTGGGFVEGDHVMKQWPEAFVKRGFIVATIDYRLGWDVDGDGGIAQDDVSGDTVPAMCEGDVRSFLRALLRARTDADAAIRFLLADPATYPIDTAAMFAGGPSAGGSLALHLAFGSEAEHLALWKAYTNSAPLIQDPCDMRYDPLPCHAVGGTSGFYQGNYHIRGVMNCWGQLMGPQLINPGKDTRSLVNDDVALISFHGIMDFVHFPYISAGCTNEPLLYGYGSIRLHELRRQYGHCSQLYLDPDAKHREVWVDGMNDLSGSAASHMRQLRADFIAERTCCFFKSTVCGTPCSYDAAFAMDGIDDWAQAYYDLYGTSEGEPVGCKNNGRMRFSLPDSAVAGASPNGLLLFIEPGTGAVHLVWSGGGETAPYMVFDAVGRTVLQGTAKNGGEGLDVSLLNSGVYVVVLDDAGTRYGARWVRN